MSKKDMIHNRGTLEEGSLMYRTVKPGDTSRGVYDKFGDRKAGTKTLGAVKTKKRLELRDPDKGPSPADRKSRFDEEKKAEVADPRKPSEIEKRRPIQDIIRDINRGHAAMIVASKAKLRKQKLREDKDELRAMIAAAMERSKGAKVTKVPAGATSGITNKRWKQAAQDGGKVTIKKAVMHDPESFNTSATFRGTYAGRKFQKENWIAKAIKKPGAMTQAAKAEGVSNSKYEQEHKHDSGKAGKRARLALVLKKLHEEVEAINELSKETLSHYVHKAHASFNDASTQRDNDRFYDERGKNMVDSSGRLKWKDRPHNKKVADDKTIQKRLTGLKTAHKKLAAEEVEAINELSLKTKMGAYAATQDPEADYSYGSKVYDQGERIRSYIVKKHGEQAGKNADAHAYAQSYGRSDKPRLKSDPLASATPSSKMRKTASGKIYKQDISSKKNEIKARIGKKVADKNLNELTKKTLGNYIKAAADDMGTKRQDWNHYNRNRSEVKTKTQKSLYGDLADISHRKGDNRKKGISLAVKKMADNHYGEYSKTTKRQRAAALGLERKLKKDPNAYGSDYHGPDKGPWGTFNEDKK